MKRLNIHQIDTTGATDGDGPVYDAASGRVIWASASGGIQSIITREALTAAADDYILTIGALPIEGSPHLWVNGAILWPDVDYAITAETVTLNTPLAAGDTIWLSYQTLEEAPPASTITHPTTPTYADAVLADSPAVYLPLDETTGTVATDASGNSHSFTNGGATVGATAIAPNGSAAYSFDGINDYLTHAHQAWMVEGGTFTIEAWVVHDGSSGYRVIAAHDANNQGWWFGLVDGVLTGAISAGLGQTGGPALTPGTAYHVAMTLTGGTMRLYVNGSLTNTYTGLGWSNAAQQFYIGASHGNDGFDGPSNRYFFFDGRISDVAFYLTALTETQLAAHYAAG